MSKIIGAVEIGTSKAKALIGEVSENSVINVVGMASRLNEGMRKEKLLILEKLLRLYSALEDAEKMSGTTVDEVYLAQTGSHLKGHMLQGSASVSSSQNRVDAEDLQRAAQEAKRKNGLNLEEHMCIMFALRFFWMGGWFRILWA